MTSNNKNNNSAPQLEETAYDREEKLAPPEVPTKRQSILQRKSKTNIKEPSKGNIASKVASTMKENKKPFGPGPWGYAETPLRGPCNYLKKHEGHRITKSPLHKCSENLQRKPPVPKHNEIKINNKKTESSKKDYQRENIEMIKKVGSGGGGDGDGEGNMIRRKSIKLKYVDSKDGHTLPLSNSGLIPEYTRYNPNFGKVPKYIKKFKKLIEKYKKEIEEKKRNDAEGAMGPRLKHVTEEERKEILEGMKKNFNELLRAYLKLPVSIDTISKKQRKVKFEEELNKLEKDIYFIESHPLIYVCEDD